MSLEIRLSKVSKINLHTISAQPFLFSNSDLWSMTSLSVSYHDLWKRPATCQRGAERESGRFLALGSLHTDRTLCSVQKEPKFI